MHTEILEGGVQILNNRYQRYAPWINWKDILRDPKAPLDIKDNDSERG